MAPPPLHDENTPLRSLPTLSSLSKTTTKGSGRRRPGSGLHMRTNSTQLQHTPTTATMGVMTPPPEQSTTMSTASSSSGSTSGSGRKRVRSLHVNTVAPTSATAAAQASPNPKARKQLKTVPAQSSPTKRRAKHGMRDFSSSPEPAGGNVRYSPPREQFTPPRTVYIPVVPQSARRTPTPARAPSLKARGRSSTPARNRAPTPIPPGSPGEDPILLVGPEPDWSAHARDLEPQPKEEELESVIPPTPVHHSKPTHSPGNISIFDLPPDADDSFTRMGDASQSESEDEDEAVVEEFEVPVKQDPPTARTKARMDRFGRPNSPYPLQRSNASLIQEEDEDEDEEMEDEHDHERQLPQQILPDPDSPLSKHSSRGNSPFKPVPQPLAQRFSFMDSPVDSMPSKPLFANEDVEMHEAPPKSQPQPTSAASMLRDLFSPTRVPLRPSTPRGRRTMRASRVPIEPTPVEVTADASTDNEEDRDEDEVQPLNDRSMHMSEFGMDMDESFSRSRTHKTPIDEDESEEGDEEDEEEEEDDITGPGVIQISSKDPLAAARAAAILKKHHKYIQEGLLHRSLSKSKANRSSRSISRSRTGSPAAFSVVSNDDLLRLSEAEVALESHPRTPAPALHPRTPAPAPSHPPSRAWAKDDWKLLDACFTAVREESGRMLDVDEVQPREVVQRFLAVMELDENESELVGEWSRDKLLRRVIALRTKQKGNPAPASSVIATPRGGSGSRAPSETPSMRVPDFTPQVTAFGLGGGRMYADLNRLEGSLGSVPALKRPDFSKTHSSSSNFEFKRPTSSLKEMAFSRDGTPESPVSSSKGTPAHGTFEFPRKVSKGLREVPPELLAPRYKAPSSPASLPPATPQHTSLPPATPQRASANTTDAPPSTARRVMGYLSSWLSVSKSQPVPASKLPQPVRMGKPGLPAPPPPRPRAVATPPRRPAERARAPSVPLHAPPPKQSIQEPRAEVAIPRDMVELQHAEQIRREQERAVPHKDTVELAHAEPIQRPLERVVHPRELVELHHVSPPPPPPPPRQRTASGSSVKDLVKCFENAGGVGVGATGRNADLEMAKMKMRRTRSLQGLQSFGQAQTGASASAVSRTASAANLGRPSWR